jgi:hypothetical protein
VAESASLGYPPCSGFSFAILLPRLSEPCLDLTPFAVGMLAVHDNERQKSCEEFVEPTRSTRDIVLVRHGSCRSVEKHPEYLDMTVLGQGDAFDRELGVQGQHEGGHVVSNSIRRW